MTEIRTHGRRFITAALERSAKTCSEALNRALRESMRDSPVQMKRIEIDYTTPDGVNHHEAIELCGHPLVSVESIFVDGVRVPKENITLVGR